MAQPIVLDVETQLTFRDIGKYDPEKLKVSVAGMYNYATDELLAFTEGQLPQLFPFLENASMIIGFNVVDFDLPVINPYYVGDLLRLPTLDLLKHVEVSLGRRISLDELVKETLNTKKNGHGLLAIEYYRQGQIDKLKEYCLHDVVLTRDLYEFGKKHGKVFYKDINIRKEIPVAWGKENNQVKSQVNLTIPW